MVEKRGWAGSLKRWDTLERAVLVQTVRLTTLEQLARATIVTGVRAMLLMVVGFWFCGVAF